MNQDPEKMDPATATLASVSTALAKDYVDPDNNPWKGSPFEWIQSRPSRQKGAIGEILVAKWAETCGFHVSRSGDSDADRIINGHRVEIKMSNLWENGIYKFQQIRDQQYDYAFCLGISPFEAHAWFIPKVVLMTDRPPALVPQHGGAAGRDTRWLSFLADSPPDWLSPYGGDLDQVRSILDSAGFGPYSAPDRTPSGRPRR